VGKRDGITEGATVGSKLGLQVGLTVGEKVNKLPNKYRLILLHISPINGIPSLEVVCTSFSTGTSSVVMQVSAS
jgi:hypothetical protein